MFKSLIITIVLLGFLHSTLAQCDTPSPTTASGTHAPAGPYCSGDLIFEDEFDEFDLKKWSHENTLGGGGNWEFEWYTNSRYNSYSEDGILYIKPTLLADETGEEFLSSGHLDINGGSPADECTNPQFYGCIRDGTPTNYLNPIKSARIRTVYSFSFKYGKAEIRAKAPAGDWLWPAIWFLPRWNLYSGWPISGEIDLMESRGNRNLVNGSGVNIGTQMVGSTLHWGPGSNYNMYMITHTEKLNPNGFDSDWHNYQMTWDEKSISFAIDNEPLARFEPPEGGFWEWGNFDSTGLDNPWKHSKSKLAPFDQEFYIILNLACGGTAYFPDDATNPGGKPWVNTSPTASTDFWKGKDQWLPTWQLETDNAAFKIDYVKIWAL
ncbi:beta-1,3-glucan-binding protein-like [Tribolium madens]|uniref:beta-1,3-glucan-binding protein-like n=1 Tax=Tribolium madens TaxID=41895 RepID=UPI001CF7260E|nr:beta-1,3-glucan-binding protein-like [Tribolium madens]